VRCRPRRSDYGTIDAQLEPDGEQQEHNAKLGNVVYLLGTGNQCENTRADDHTGHQITKHEARPQALENGGDNDGGDQKNERFAQKGGVMHIRRLVCQPDQGKMNGFPPCIDAVAPLQPDNVPLM